MMDPPVLPSSPDPSLAPLPASPLPSSSPRRRGRGCPHPSSDQQDEDRNTSSMTLAISRSDATRMLEASRKFNTALSRIQKEEMREIEEEAAKLESDDNDSGDVTTNDNGGPQAEPALKETMEKLGVDGIASPPRDKGIEQQVANPNSPEDGAVDKGDNPDQMKGVKSKAENDKKTLKDKADGPDISSPTVDDGMMDLDLELDLELEKRSPSPSKDNAETEHSNNDRTDPSPPRSPPKRVSTSLRRCRRRRPRNPTPLHELLVRSALSCGDDLIVSYLQRMRDRNCAEREVQTSLLLFLDMDKSTKLLSAFRVMRKNRESESDGATQKLKIEDSSKKGNDNKVSVAIKVETVDDGEGAEGTTDMDLDNGPSKGNSCVLNDDVSHDSLKDASNMCLSGDERDQNDNNKRNDEDDMLPGAVTYKAMKSMFRCFLTSISTCIHHDHSDNVDGKSPSKVSRKSKNGSPRSSLIAEENMDWTLTSRTEREIEEIASFAADCLADHVIARDLKKADESEIKTEHNKEFNSLKDSELSRIGAVINFEAFGDWYNSGGFSLVPWLELLDLAKWDFASRAAAAAAAASTSSERHQSHSDASREQGLCIGSIIEESKLDMVLEDSPARTLFNDVPPPPVPEPKEAKSRTVVSFDFTGAMPSAGPGGQQRPFHICITEENLRMLKNLVNRTGLSDTLPGKVADILLRHSTPKQLPASEFGSEQVAMMLHRDDFGRCIRDIVPSDMSRLFDRVEMENYSNYLTIFFTCFNNSGSTKGSPLGQDYVNAKELAVGFSFLCSGNKSTKLATAFELLDDERVGYLTQKRLTQYLRSYLTMLVGISLLSSSTEKTAETRRMLINRKKDGKGSSGELFDMFTAVENGARWTQQQFVRAFEAKHKHKSSTGSTRTNAITFEDFAQWYTEGGYIVAPWLELLDLNKFLSLINGTGGDSNTDGIPQSAEKSHYDYGRNNLSTPRIHTLQSPQHHPVDVLFTFPLANRRALVILREDATYVRQVVTQLGLLSMLPEETWVSLYAYVHSCPPPVLQHDRSQHHKSGKGKGMDVDQNAFVKAMENIIQPGGRKQSSSASGDSSVNSTTRETLQNFFQSFDLNQVDRVAANELMGGLTLLCGGKKSSKLAFAFGLFDGRGDEKKAVGRSKPVPPPGAHSLDDKELFLFLRSFLVVMFSCCKQSLHLTADQVSRYIYDTAYTVAEDVMRFQRHRKQSSRVDFDEFGEWYNEGGFETAPWLELLDLKKWVLLDDFDGASVSHRSDGGAESSPREKVPTSPYPKGGVRRGGRHPNSALASPSPNHCKRKTICADFLQEQMVEKDDDINCPPPPPDDAIDPNTDPFFGEDMHMDGIDDIAFGNLPQDSNGDKENEGNLSSNSPRMGTIGAPLLSPTLTPPPPRGEIERSQLPQPAQQPPPPPQPPQMYNQAAKHKLSSRERSVAPHSTNTPPASTSLKFHLLTNDDHGGYMISISQIRIRHLRQLVIDSGLYKIDVAAACNRILERANRTQPGADGTKPPPDAILTKDKFDSAMRHIVALSKSRMITDTQRHLSELLTSIFHAFSCGGTGEVIARELACGFTVLCGGRKSDKLEFAFDLLDSDKDGRFNRNEMERYLQSFLTTLLSIATSSALEGSDTEDALTLMKGNRCSYSSDAILRTIEAGSRWATTQVFDAISVSSNKQKSSKSGDEKISFDDFAEWYTKGGYTSIPWLELLDLRKWVLTVPPQPQR